MSERLQRFRKLMAAFEGTSNPQHAIKRGYYVDSPNNLVGDITRRVELRPSSVHLLLGGIGSGKTTQLLLAQEHLNQLEGFKAIYVDVSLHTDISQLEPGALVVIAGLEIEKLLTDVDDEDFHVTQNKLKALADGEYLYQDHEDHYEGNDIYFFKPGILKRDISKSQFNQLSQELITTFQKLWGTFISQLEGDVVFIFDGLDRLSHSNIFINSALNDVMALSKSGIGVIIVGSIPITYTKGIENFSNYIHYFPYLNVAEDIEAKKFFMNILNIRDLDNFITLDTKEFLIIQSGGVLRDLVSLTQSAIEEAYVNGSDNITLEHAQEAVASLARSKFMGLTDENLKMLQQVVSQKNFTPRTPEDLELLLTGHILEYRHPRKHFAVHPVLIPLIQGIQEENRNLSVVHG
jgi:hypothetical protein